MVSLPRIDTAFALKPQQKFVQAEGWKQSLVQIGNQLIRSEVDPPTRAQKATIRSIAESLETINNPTPRPALSELPGGMWKCLYTNAPGPSGGKLGPFVGRVYQDVNMASKQYANILKVGKKGTEPWLTARLVATWEVKDEDTWEVLFKHLELRVFGRAVLHREFKNVRRLWRMTYLDDQLRIMRAKRPGKADDQAFLFVLQRDNGVGR